MLNKEIQICKILTFSEEDLLAFSLEFSSSGVDVILYNKSHIEEYNAPMLIVGWANVKKYFPKQRISQQKITNKISWVYSISEDKINSIIDAKKFIKNIISVWLPDTYITYDYVLNDRLNKFMDENFIKPYKFFLYFSGKAMYLYNTLDDRKIFGISLESMKYSGVDVKKFVTVFFEKHSPICLSYTNVSPYLNEKHEPFFETVENLFWARHFEEINEKYFYDFMMDTESDRFIPFLMSELYSRYHTTQHEELYVKRLNKKDYITGWLSKREMFFDKKYNNDKIEFKKSSDGLPYARLIYSNKRTITGRINCADRRFNPQNLQKESDAKKMIISRYKSGKIVVFDYVSFETKISLFLSQDVNFIEEYKNKDLHEETAKVIFQNNMVNVKERLVGKSINHALLYGAGEEKLKLLISDVPNSDTALERVKLFLSPIIEYSKQIQLNCEELGYMINSFGTIIKPQKTWASFVNFVSAMAADILVEKLYIIRSLLSDKKSKFIFQVHDSFIFDIHPDEKYLAQEIQNILSDFNNNIHLQVNSVEGNNLYECTISEDAMELEETVLV